MAISGDFAGRGLRTIRIAPAKVKARVGDLRGRSGLILRYLKEAESTGANLVCFPELALCGYPPEDPVLKRISTSRK